jgi:pimeloyl-ACP methyl ester carboxylesterase
MMVPAAFAAQEIKTLTTRPNVSLKILLMKPETDCRTVLLMFPGGNGAFHFTEKNGKFELGKNFLLRTAADFVKKGLAVAVVDTPSDQRLGMDDSFRVSKEHRDDIERAILFLVGQGYDSIYLVGTSRGTISAAYLGTVLKDKQVKGLVLTSSMSYPNYLIWTPLEETRCPVLLIHHVRDGCRSTPYADALALQERYANHTKVDFVALEGGSPPQSGSCEPLSQHGFFGIEEKAIQAIYEWVRKTDAPTAFP